MKGGFLSYQKLGFIIMLAGLLAACNSNSSGDAQLKEAAALHEGALKIESDLKPMLEELVQQRNSLSVQGRALTEEEQAFIDQVYALESSYEAWEKSHLEVPGAAHHDHKHHDHDHGTDLELSPPDMLMYQKEFRDSILAIRDRAKKMIDQ